MKTLAYCLCFAAMFGSLKAEDIPKAIIHVNVIPMNVDTVLANQTVLVRDGKIAAIGESIELPADAEIIDAKNAYLMPGLSDMHTHLAAFDPNPKHLVLYLAEGTTTIRSVGESPKTLAWREQVRNGSLVGPTIYSTGRTMGGNDHDFIGFSVIMILFRVLIFLIPLLALLIVFAIWKHLRSRRTWIIGTVSALIAGTILTLTKTPPFMILEPILFPEWQGAGIIIESESQAHDEIADQKLLNVDAVKLYDGLTEEIYLQSVVEAKSRNIYIISHLLDHSPLSTLLSSGVNEIAHLDEFNTHHWVGSFSEVLENMRHNIDPVWDTTRIAQAAELMKKNDVAVVSNISADEVACEMIFDTPGVEKRPEYRVIRPVVRSHWLTSGRPVRVWTNQGRYRKNEMAYFKQLIREFHKAGVIITTGTDCSANVEGTVPSKIHRELELLVESGLSNYDALAAATRLPGDIVKRMGKDGNFGTVAAGQRADLLMLESNPLENVSNTRKRLGVMVRGQWFSQDKLDALVEQYVKAF